MYNVRTVCFGKHRRMHFGKQKIHINFETHLQKEISFTSILLSKFGYKQTLIRLRYFIDNLQNCVTVFTNFCILDDFSKSYFFRIETNNHLKKLKYNIFFIKYLYKKDKLRGLNYIISNQV